MKMSLNNLGDVQELTALPVWECTPSMGGDHTRKEGGKTQWPRAIS